MEFFVSRNMFCGNNSTIFFQKGNRSGRPKEITVTVPVVIQTQLCVLMVKGRGYGVSFIRYLQLLRLIPFWFGTRTEVISLLYLVWKNGKIEKMQVDVTLSQESLHQQWPSHWFWRQRHWTDDVLQCLYNICLCSCIPKIFLIKGTSYLSPDWTVLGVGLSTILFKKFAFALCYCHRASWGSAVR